jgi:hypothetical protein
MAVEWRRVNLEAIGSDWRIGEGEARELIIAGVRAPRTERTDMLKGMAIISCADRCQARDCVAFRCEHPALGRWRVISKHSDLECTFESQSFVIIRTVIILLSDSLLDGMPVNRIY